MIQQENVIAIPKSANPARLSSNLDIFDFDYQLECYVPSQKRKRGYFSLPVLYKDRLVGTMDAKAHRKEGVFSINSFQFDQYPEDKEDFLESFHRELKDFAAFNKCPHVEGKDTVQEKMIFFQQKI